MAKQISKQHAYCSIICFKWDKKLSNNTCCSILCFKWDKKLALLHVPRDAPISSVPRVSMLESMPFWFPCWAGENSRCLFHFFQWSAFQFASAAESRKAQDLTSFWVFWWLMQRTQHAHKLCWIGLRGWSQSGRASHRAIVLIDKPPPHPILSIDVQSRCWQVPLLFFKWLFDWDVFQTAIWDEASSDKFNSVREEHCQFERRRVCTSVHGPSDCLPEVWRQIQSAR